MRDDKNTLINAYADRTKCKRSTAIKGRNYGCFYDAGKPCECRMKIEKSSSMKIWFMKAKWKMVDFVDKIKNMMYK